MKSSLTVSEAKAAGATLWELKGWLDKGVMSVEEVVAPAENKSSGADVGERSVASDQVERRAERAEKE
eukprot:6544955-Karenia_brevis.AAC.1